MWKKTTLLVLCFCVSFVYITVASGYEIKAKITGLKENDTCYLGHYFGQHQLVKDTAISNSRSEICFSGKDDLEGGIYFIVLPDKNFFEIIIDKEQKLNIETDTAELVKNMKIKGSKENLLFYEYLVFLKTNQSEYEKYKSAFKNNTDSVDFYKNKMTEIDESMKTYKLNFISQNPDFLISKVFLASKDPDVPEAPVLPNGRKDSTFAYYYYKQHFWDNIDLTDDRLIRTPVFYNRINYFFSKVVPQDVDSIIKESDILIEKTRENKTVFKYVVWYITYTYETSTVMGFDAVFVHMVEKYYMTNQCFWISPTVLDNITKRAMKLKPILLGKTTPNLIMQDTNLNLQSLHAVKAQYTILLFWDYECGHCRTEVPEIHEYYLEYKDKYDIEVFAVCTDTNMVKMKSFIIEHNLDWINVNGPRAITPPYAETYDIYSTPVIFILDDKKTILAKRIPGNKIIEFIEMDLKRNKKE